MSQTIAQAESAVGWELRGALLSRRVVRLVLSDACDGVLPAPNGLRMLEGRITGVAATNAYCIILGRHVPLAEVRAVVKPHFSHGPASDPTDPMSRIADYTDAPLGIAA